MINILCKKSSTIARMLLSRSDGMPRWLAFHVVSVYVAASCVRAPGGKTTDPFSSICASFIVMPRPMPGIVAVGALVVGALFEALLVSGTSGITSSWTGLSPSPAARSSSNVPWNSGEAGSAAGALVDALLVSSTLGKFDISGTGRTGLSLFHGTNSLPNVALESRDENLDAGETLVTGTLVLGSSC